MPIVSAEMPITKLTDEQAGIVRATLPLIGTHIDTITRAFYSGLFQAHPELLRNLFNRGNQAQGSQQRALAASIATHATHLVTPELAHPAKLLSRIGHKHASLGITPEQYEVVHEYLFAAIVDVLGAAVVTADVAGAWSRVYWSMAESLIDLERQLYASVHVATGQVYRRATVTRRVEDPSGAIVVTVRTDEPLTGPDHPGQYVSVGVELPDGARQLRQYSLLTAPDRHELIFAVKPVTASDVRPSGEVSSVFARTLTEGDIIDVTVPFGDLPTADLGEAPVVLASAGIGVTPMIGILDHLTRTGSDVSVQVLHADESAATHPLREHHRMLVDALPNATLTTWYAEGDEGDRRGHMTVRDTYVTADSIAFICGGDDFVASIRRQLLDSGVDSSRIHCELFSPNDWLLG